MQLTELGRLTLEDKRELDYQIKELEKRIENNDEPMVTPSMISVTYISPGSKMADVKKLRELKRLRRQIWID